MSTSPPLSRRAIRAIVLDLLAEELGRSRGRSALELGRSGWTEDTRADAGTDGRGLDLDSLERLDVSAALNEYFHLHEYGAEDYLLALPNVGEWCDLVAESLDATGERLTVRTSGSTGEPKRCTHAVADLRAEAAEWARMFHPVAGVIALVPAQHIYGTIFTAMLPDAVGPACPVERAAGAEAVRRAPPGTVVVATPTMWAYLARSLLAFPPGLVGVSSTAPLPAQLAHRLRGQRLARMVEAYGSSETGGVAFREREDAPFALLDRWERVGDDAIAQIGADGERVAAAMPDEGEWLDDRRFVLRGRRDGAVQIGGVNVFPERVRATLLAHAGVADAAVRLEAATGRLKAFVVPARGGDDDALAGELDRWCGARLPAVQRPRRFAVGAALPVGATGKPADW